MKHSIIEESALLTSLFVGGGESTVIVKILFYGERHPWGQNGPGLVKGKLSLISFFPNVHKELSSF